MARREVKDYTNIDLGKSKKDGDGEESAYKKMVAKLQDTAGERGGYLHGRGALDADDLLYLKEQEEQELDKERARIRKEKRAFAAFKAAASKVDKGEYPNLLLAPRPEPKIKEGPKSQADIVRTIVAIKPKRQRTEEGPAEPSHVIHRPVASRQDKVLKDIPPASKEAGGLLGLVGYASESDSEGEKYADGGPSHSDKTNTRTQQPPP